MKPIYILHMLVFIRGASASLCPADSNGLQLADRLSTASIGPDQRFLTLIRTMPQFGPWVRNTVRDIHSKQWLTLEREN